MANNLVYVNGNFVAASQAGISVFDAGFLHGASVFTTLLAHNGRPFRLERHLDRLMANAERIALAHAAARPELAGAIDQLLERNGLDEARIRITLSPGPVDGTGRATTVVTASPVENPSWWYEKGLGVIVSAVRQYEGDPIAGVKTGCYLTRILARQAAAAAGADEALWFNLAGNLSEACFCNVFLLVDGQLFTPPEDTPVLPGVVRQAVLELCEQLDIPVRTDEPVTGEQVRAAEEMFLTSSVAGIRPVVRVQRVPVGDEKPGPVTGRILAAYRSLLDKECPPKGA